MINNLEKSIILEELGIDFIWRIRKKTNNKNKIYHLYFLNLINYNILFASVASYEKDEEAELFKNISLYLNSQSINESLNLSLNIDYNKMMHILESSKYDYIFLLGKDPELLNFFDKEKINNMMSFSLSLDEVLTNPSNKKILWQDIQIILTKINGKNNNESI